MHRTPLGVAAAADQAGVLEHPQVLGDGLDADVVGLGEIPDGGVGDRQPGDHVAPRGVGQGREDPGERIGGHRGVLPSSTVRLRKSVDLLRSFVNHLVEKADVPARVGPSAYARVMFPGGQPDMSELLKQAQQMQQQLAAAQEQLAQEEVTGTAGGDLVSVTMTGQGEVTAVTIAPAAVDPDDLETLQDLIVAAFRDASRAVNDLTASRMGPLAGGLGGGLGLPGL